MHCTVRVFGNAIAAAILLSQISTTSAALTASQTQINWDARTTIVWPHDGSGRPTHVAQSRAVNVSVWPVNQVDCLASPFITLFIAKDNEPAQLVLGLGDVDGVAEPSEPPYGHPGLLSIELPRMEIDHGRLALALVDVSNRAARDLVREEAEVAAARHRQSLAEHGERRERDRRR